MRYLATATAWLFLLAAAAPTVAQTAIVFGLTDGCDVWRSRFIGPMPPPGDIAWIEGYLSGRNVERLMQKNRTQVGGGTKPIEIINKITEVCVANPSQRVIWAVDKAYAFFDGDDT